MNRAAVERAMAHLYGMATDRTGYDSLAKARATLATALGLDPNRPPERLGEWRQIGRVTKQGPTRGMWDPRYVKAKTDG